MHRHRPSNHKQIGENIDGEIGCDSSVDVGSTFSVEFPRDEPA